MLIVGVIVVLILSQTFLLNEKRSTHDVSEFTWVRSIYIYMIKEDSLVPDLPLKLRLRACSTAEEPDI